MWAAWSGEALGLKQLLGKMWFWFGSQGWEYLEIGRVWQILLVIGLIVWTILLVRGVGPARRDPAEREITTLFLLSAFAIPFFYLPAFFFNTASHFTVADTWRFWIIHLWVEGFFELFVTVMVAVMFYKLNMVTRQTATRVIYLDAILFLGSGIIGTGHHWYWTGQSAASLALSSTFSAMEVVPLILLTLDASDFMRLMRSECEICGQRIGIPHKWTFYFLISVGVWNFIGAGVFGFLINLPVVSYYEVGTNLTAEPRARRADGRLRNARRGAAGLRPAAVGDGGRLAESREIHPHFLLGPQHRAGADGRVEPVPQRRAPVSGLDPERILARALAGVPGPAPRPDLRVAADAGGPDLHRRRRRAAEHRDAVDLAARRRSRRNLTRPQGRARVRRTGFSGRGQPNAFFAGLAQLSGKGRSGAGDAEDVAARVPLAGRRGKCRGRVRARTEGRGQTHSRTSSRPTKSAPGTWTVYATTCRECPAGCGMHVRVTEGRPIKAEGNPDHPINRGGLCARGQSCVQGLYDPDRLRTVLHGKEQSNWDAAISAIGARLREADGKVAILSDLQTGALAEVMERFAAAFGSSRVLCYEPFNYEPLRVAHDALFGLPVVPAYDLESCEFIISFGADFLETWISPVEYARQFAQMHSLREGKIGRMVYVGPRFSMTAANADDFLMVPAEADNPVALAMLQVMLDEGWAQGDAASIRKIVAGLPKPRLPGEVSMDRVRELARRFAQANGSVALAGPVGMSDISAKSTACAAALLNYAAARIGKTVDLLPRARARPPGNERAGEQVSFRTHGRRPAHRAQQQSGL